MNYKLYIFDFDGTLADTYPWFTSVVNVLADKHRFNRVNKEEEHVLRGLTTRKIIQYLGIPTWKLPLISADARRLMKEQIETIKLFDGVDELLTRITDSGGEVGIVSSNAEENIRIILGERNAKKVKFFQCGASVFGKPSKINRILKSSRYPDAAIYIGDETRDVEAAKKSSIDSGAVAWGYNRIEAILSVQPVQVFNHMEDICA